MGMCPLALYVEDPDASCILFMSCVSLVCDHFFSDVFEWLWLRCGLWDSPSWRPFPVRSCMACMGLLPSPPAPPPSACFLLALSPPRDGILLACSSTSADSMALAPGAGRLFAPFLLSVARSPSSWKGSQSKRPRWVSSRLPLFFSRFLLHFFFSPSFSRWHPPRCLFPTAGRSRSCFFLFCFSTVCLPHRALHILPPLFTHRGRLDPVKASVHARAGRPP